MERTKSLSERDAKRDSSSPLSTSTSKQQEQSHTRELHRTSSLGLDLICKQFGVSWLRPSSSNVSCSIQPSSSQNLPSPSGQTTPNAQHTSHSHLPFQSRQIIESPESNCKIAGKFFPNYELIDNLMHELRSRSTGSLESRLRIIDDLANAVRTQQLNEQTYSKILRDTAEFLDKSQPNEVRHKVWRLYTQLVQGRAEYAGHYRYLMFDLIRKNDNRPEDIPCRIDFLIALTDNGKTCVYYEQYMAELMERFVGRLLEKKNNDEYKAKKLPTEVQTKFLKFMTELVKYNASIMPKALKMMIRYACTLAYESSQLSELQAIYNFLNVVLSYSHLPLECLNQFVIVNCIGVNREELRQICIQVMRNLIGTYLGFACLNTLNHIIEDETNYNDKVLIRGAVFFLVQSLWGDLSNEKVFISPNSVLPAFKNLILNESIASPFIALEVANGIHVFLSNVLNPSDQRRQSQPNIMMKSDLSDDYSGKIIFECTWELVLDICHLLVGNITMKEQQSTKLVSTVQLLIEKLKELLQKILSLDVSSQSESSFQLSESISIALLMSNDKFVPKIFSILELGINYLSDESIFNLIPYKLNYIGNYQNWISEMKHLIEVFYKGNVNSAVRAQFLTELQSFLDNNYHFVSVDSFWDKVASSYFIQSEQNCPELAKSIEFLLYLAKKSNSPKHLSEIVGILEKMASYHLKTFFQRQHSVEFTSHQQLRGHTQIMHQLSAPNQTEKYSSDPVQSINGLIIIFREKLDHPTCYAQAINAFNLVIKFYSQFLKVHPTELDLHSHVQMRTKTVILLKQMIFDMILSLRSNSMGQLGVVISHPQQQNNYTPNQLCALSNEEFIKFTSYIVLCDPRQLSPPTSPLQSQISLQQPLQRQSKHGSTVSSSFQATLYDALIHVLDCIRMETEWLVLELVFKKLAKMLKNKGLILSLGKYPSASSPTPSLVHLKTEPSFPDLVVNVLDKFIDTLHTRLSDFVFSDTKLAKADVLTFVYMSISELVGYSLHSSNQCLVIKCLKNGLVQFSSKIQCIRQCIISLTICSMEMQTTMNKFLKDIILTLSQITTSKVLAVPKLEFLSNIILFPDLYYTFTGKQYLSVFSIALQYVNPYNKYGEYAVVLALRVISMWFLKCPSPYRLSLMKFITKGLNTNILKEVEPTTPQPTSQRLSSLSLSSEHRTKLENRLSLTSSPPPPPTTPVNISSQFSFSFHSSNIESHHPHYPLTSSSSSAFNVCATTSPQMITDGSILDPNDKEKSKVELVEVCMDMFSTNVFNTSSPLPLKPSMIDKLLNRQKSQMWIIGHKIVQITTTGCSSRAIRNGLCNKCFYICHLNEKDSSASIDDSNSLLSGNQANAFSNRASFSTQLSYDQTTSPSVASSRRRHQSEISSSNSKLKSSQFTNDDYFMKRTPISSSDPDLDNNACNKYCRCWCQSWAEILIRRSTGNTRWIMRVENNLGDFPYWCYSKEEDDSLANLFSHADPEINLALKLQKAAEMEPDENIEMESTMFNNNDGQSVSKMIHEAAMQHGGSNIETIAQRPRVSIPVTRASSFGSRRPTIQANFLEHHTSLRLQEEHLTERAYTQANSHLNRRLEKDFSVDEDEPPIQPLETYSYQVSPVASTSSSDTIKENFNAVNYRERSTTISVMSPVQKSASSSGVSGVPQPSIYDNSKSTSTLSLSSNRPSISSGALSPQTVFLQLYYNSTFKEMSEFSLDDKPILLDKNDALVRAISVLDRVTPYETHKIGVLYIGPGQVNSKTEILANQMGSFRYTLFLQKLGHTINLEDVDSNVCYTGGLDSKKDGPFAISWGDHLVQTIFHVATFMPTLGNDPNSNNKMAHIGNDFICIVYNNSGEKFDISTIKGEGQFLQAMVVITPLEHESNSVQIYGMAEFIDFIGHTETQIISDNSLPVYVRQLALHANIAAMVKNSNKHQKSYNISNWITRLQNIKRIRTRAIDNLPFNPVNPELIHMVRSSHPLQSYNRARLGTGPSQSSRDEADSVISSSVASPNIPGSAGLSAGISGAFDYDSHARFAFPDFNEFCKDLS